MGRYKLISTQVGDYCYGLYERPPGPIDPDVLRAVFKYHKRDRGPITCRPADLFQPELSRAKETLKDFTRDMGDVLTAALHPITGFQFLKRKFGLDTGKEISSRSIDG